MPAGTFLTLENSEQLRGKLHDLISTTNFDDYRAKYGIVLTASDFDWLAPVVKTTLDKYLSTYLAANPPEGERFVSLDVIEHLREVTELINKCNDRRNTIFDLESRAILLGLEYFQFLETFNSDVVLGGLTLKATYAESGLGVGEEKYTDAFAEKTLTAFDGLRSKLSIHNEKGSSLNYGERVSYLRDLYCDDIRRIYERLIAIKRTLKYSFGQKTAELPNIKDVVSKLDLIVWWVRKAVREFETAAEHEYFFERTVSLGTMAEAQAPVAATPHGDHHVGADNNLLPDFKGPRLPELINNGIVEFELSEQDFALRALPIGGRYKMRVIGIAVNVIEDYKQEPRVRPSRNTRLYYCEINPPKQNIALEIGEIFDLTLEERKKITDRLDAGIIKVNDIIDPRIGKIVGIDNNGRVIFERESPQFEGLTFPNVFVAGDVKPVHETSILDEQRFYSPKAIRNINPVGRWRVYLRNSTLGNMQRFFGLSQVMDLSLTFRLAIRPE